MMWNSVENNSPNFGARHLLKTSIVEKVANEAKNIEANLVEMKFSDINDYAVLDNLKSSWSKGEYTQMICSPSYNDSRKIQVLTLQTDGFERLDEDKILGVVDILINGEKATIRFLQGKPSIVYDKNRKIHRIGDALCNGLRTWLKEHNIKTLDVFVERSKQPFYRKALPDIRDKACTQDSYTNMILDV